MSGRDHRFIGETKDFATALIHLVKALRTDRELCSIVPEDSDVRLTFDSRRSILLFGFVDPETGTSQPFACISVDPNDENFGVAMRAEAWPEMRPN